MTLAVMRSFGVQVGTDEPGRLKIAAPQCYRPQHYEIEPDASAASYFFAAAAITGGEVTVEGLSRNSLQGDVHFCDCLERMGCEVRYGQTTSRSSGRPLRGIDVDMNAISDTVQTLAAVALFADGPTNIKGVAHIRHKETDRIHALAVELRKLGADVQEYVDGLDITPRPLHGAEIDTYDDHRMAMSLALVGLAVPGVVIRNPDCTAKTYPQFFRDLEGLATETVTAASERRHDSGGPIAAAISAAPRIRAIRPPGEAGRWRFRAVAAHVGRIGSRQLSLAVPADHPSAEILHPNLQTPTTRRTLLDEVGSVRHGGTSCHRVAIPSILSIMPSMQVLSIPTSGIDYRGT